MSAVGGLVGSDHLEPGKYICGKGTRHYDTAVPLLFLEYRQAELLIPGFTILHEMVVALVGGRGRQLAARKPDDYQGMIFVQLNDFVLLTFPREREVKDKRNYKLWNPIFNHVTEVKGTQERNMGIRWYSSSKPLLVDHIKVIENSNYTEAMADLVM